ncbi:MAG: hypothetical protein HEQ28_11085 [Prevotella sp.]
MKFRNKGNYVTRYTLKNWHETAPIGARKSQHESCVRRISSLTKFPRHGIVNKPPVLMA